MEISNSISTISNVDPKSIPTLSISKQSITQKNSEKITQKNSSFQDSSASASASAVVVSRRVRRCSSRTKRNPNICTNGGEDSESDEKIEVEKKIVVLQKIVPGGETLTAENLFEETAEYILSLQCQVKALRFLASFVEGSGKEKRKLGA